MLAINCLGGGPVCVFIDFASEVCTILNVVCVCVPHRFCSTQRIKTNGVLLSLSGFAPLSLQPPSQSRWLPT